MYSILNIIMKNSSIKISQKKKGLSLFKRLSFYSHKITRPYGYVRGIQDYNDTLLHKGLTKARKLIKLITSLDYPVCKEETSNSLYSNSILISNIAIQAITIPFYHQCKVHSTNNGFVFL